MKTAIVITGLGVGGAERVLLNVLPEIDCNPVVISLTNDNEIGEELEAQGVDVRYLGLSKKLYNLPAVAWRFHRVMRDENPDQVLSFLIHAHLFTRFLAPLYVDTIKCSIRLKHKPSFLTWLEWVTNGLVDEYIPNTPALTPWLHERGVTDDRIQMIPNGVDVDRFDIEIDVEAKKDELGIPPDAFVVGSVGRLHKQKRYQDLLDATKDLDVHVLIVGDGPERESLTEQAKENNMLERVHMPGRRYDIPEVLQTMDVFCLPSENEGMSNALLEAMAAGRCCVVSDIDENICVLNGHGLQFSSDNPHLLTSKIQSVLDDQHERIQLGETARRRVKNKFSTNEMLERYQRIFKSDSQAGEG